MMPTTKHGMFKTRTLTCEAPGCGKTFTTRAYYRGARFCSNDCRTNWGQWSYPATHATLERVYGVTKS